MEIKISDSENRNLEVTQVEESKLRVKKNKQTWKNSMRFNMIRESNIRIMSTPEKKEREKETERLVKQKINESFPNL